MDRSIVLVLLLQVVLVALNAVFASAEIAVLSISESRLKDMARTGGRRGRRLYRLTRQPAKFLAVIQVAVTLSGFLSSAFAADSFSGPLVNWLTGLGVPLSHSTLENLAVVVVTLILSCFALIFGELVPKRIAMQRPEELALALSGPVCVVSVIFRPAVWLLSAATELILRLLGPGRAGTPPED